VLETLDDIDWSKIHHAYGPASDVPAQIRALGFGDEQQQKKALWELHGNIWHQHTVYEATSFAVPFLIELVRNQVAQEEILSLIALIASGTSYLAVHRRLLPEWTSEEEEQQRRELQWVNAAKAAVAVHAEFFLALVDSPKRRLRELCILILGVIENASEITASDVIERIFATE
jgi:hypothetical protein